MSTEAATSTPAKKTVPLYKRRRRRIYGAAALVLAVIVGVVVWATTGGSGSGPLPTFTISVSQGSVASPDSIIESQPSLAKLIPAKLKYVPFEAGVTAIAEMKSGAVQAISGVGNPPLTEAIGSGTGVTVVMGWGFDDDQLLVPASVTSPAQLAGKSIGVLVGSSEDYELLGLPRAAAPDRQGQGGAVLRRDRGGRGRAVRGGRRRLRLRQPGHQAPRRRVTIRWSTPSRSPSSASPAWT